MSNCTFNGYSFANYSNISVFPCRRLLQDSTPSDPYASVSTPAVGESSRCEATYIGGGSGNGGGSCGSPKWSVPAAGGNSPTLDVDSCMLSASLFGNCAALKSFEKKSGMSIEE